MTRPSPPPDSVDIEHLQALISGFHDEPSLPSFLKPTHPSATRNPTSAFPATPTRPHPHHSLASYHTGTNTTSHDATGNLELAYPFDSQNVAGDTQVDSDSIQELAKEHLGALQQNVHDADTQQLPLDEQPDLPDTPKSSLSVVPTPVKEKLPNYIPPDSLPDSDRFIDPAATPPNIATPVRPSNSGFVSTNPLASYIANDSPGFSMTQAFNAASSPVKRTRAGSLGDSQEAPPTPSFPAARIMAKSMVIIPEEPGSPTQSGSELGHSPRPRALSAVLFSSPPPRPQPSHESDDELVSRSQVKRRKAEAARKKGAAELANFVAADPKSCPALKNEHSKHWSGNRPAPAKIRLIATNNLPVGQNAPRLKSPSRRRRPVSAPDEDVLLGRSRNVRISTSDRVAATQVPASDPPEPEETSSIPQASAADLDETWARLHGPQTLTKRIRRAKSTSALRPDESPHPEKLRYTNTAPSILQANAASPVKSGTSLMPTSLRAMVPFNIPSPPGDQQRSPPKWMPSFVQESSGLEAGNAANGPTPNTSSDTAGSSMETDHAITDDPMLEPPQFRIIRGATVPGTSSNDDDEEERSNLQDSPLKRKRPMPSGANSPKPLRRFVSLENSQPVLSSREEPDDVDMDSIIHSVGMGADADEDTSSSAPTAKRRKAAPKKPTTKSAAKSPLPADRNNTLSPAPSSSFRSAKGKSKQAKERLGRAAKSTLLSIKTPVRKITKDTRKPASARQSSLRKSAASATSYVEVSSDDDEEDSPLDHLATTNPAFHISSSTPLQPAMPANRVFALWKDRDLYYYPATILSRENANSVRVQFDDDSVVVLMQQNIRSLTLQPGDTVKVDLPDLKKQQWTIHSFPRPGPPTPYTDTASHTHVLLTPKRTSATTLDPITVPITNLYLVKSLWPQFSKRDTSAGSITIPLRPSARTHTPLRTHTPATHTPSFTAPPPPLFTNMCFALSQLPADAASTIRSNGGLIVQNSLEELFKPSSTPLELLPEHATLTFTAVIAPSHSRTPKFLQALALGVPCLAPRWVADCVRLQRLVDWRMYLLPAGLSAYLECVHSRVLPAELDAVGWRLGDVVAGKREGGLMAGWEVDVYVPRAGERQAAFVFLVRALGAGRVREVRTVEGLEAEVVLCPDADVEVVRRGVKAGRRVLSEEDVVQGLILGGFVEG